jgi:imidazolonepropionase-like amidohydrolase
MQRILILATLAALVAGSALSAGDEIPGAPQRQPIALINATIHTAAGAPISNATLVFDKGVITAVGASAQIPEGARTIDCKGARVYPGFIAPSTTLGLTEIDAVRSTRDFGEVGSLNPNARAETAYNPDSEIIPTVRSNGVLLVNSTPQGGLVSGQSSLMRLDGWTREDLAVKRVSGLILSWPAMEITTAWWQRKSADEQRKDIEQNVRQVYDLFTAARGYSEKARAGVDTSLRDIRFEAMRCVFEDSVPVIVECATRRQIESVLDFAQTMNVRVILSGAVDAPLVLEQLQRAGVGIIIPRVHALPRREEDGYDAAFTLPATLAKAGIPFAFSDDGAWQQRNLPFHAGTARAFGMSELDALRGLTLWPAQLFGVAATYGSLEVGKSATLFVSTGDAMDSKSNNVIHAFIDGRELELNNRHKRLAKKYRERSKR